MFVVVAVCSFFFHSFFSVDALDVSKWQWLLAALSDDSDVMTGEKEGSQGFSFSLAFLLVSS